MMRRVRTVGVGLVWAAGCGAMHGQTSRPWMDVKLPPEKRAELVLREMTLDEKIGLLHGEGMPGWPNMTPTMKAMQATGLGGAGLVLGVERLGIPRIEMSDAAYGVRASADNGRYSTALPSNLASAASWDKEAACAYGTLIGKELRAQGYNMTLGGGVNITREPRNGRTFEYMGEDPVLAGTLVGNRIRCEGEQHVISDIKHFALNDQESGRQKVNIMIDEKAMRESDLLAFELGLKIGDPKAVMCAYNGVNGDYACENKHLLSDVLKRDWGFKGFVISDWGATHSTVKASAAGLDQEQPLADYYGEALKAGVQKGIVSMAELDDHVRRILWAEFASGVVDNPVRKSVVDVEAGFETARKLAEQSAVLLKNQGFLLPLDRSKVRSIAVIGLHADTGMISGGGSAQVDPQGAVAGGAWRRQVWFPTSPLKAIQARMSEAPVSFASGQDIAEAVKQAKAADVAVVFAYQWEAEEKDLSDLSLPEGQDALIAAVAAATPRTIVVLETGGAVTMPWLQKVAGVLEVWYAGSKGAEATANLLFGDVSPSGKLPMTFPLSEKDLPRTKIAGPPANAGKEGLSFAVTYDEGAKVGYKLFEATRRPVLFPFGFGLSYATFRYGMLHVGKDISTATFTVTNTGKRRGMEIAEVYAVLPTGGDGAKRLVGWQKLELAAGESRVVHVALEPLALSIWQESVAKWYRVPGRYDILIGGSSADLPVSVTVDFR